MNSVIDLLEMELKKAEAMCSAAYKLYTFFSERADMLTAYDHGSMEDHSEDESWAAVFTRKDMYADELRRLDLEAMALRECIKILMQVSMDQNLPVETKVHEEQVSDSVRRMQIKVRSGGS